MFKIILICFLLFPFTCLYGQDYPFKIEKSDIGENNIISISTFASIAAIWEKTTAGPHFNYKDNQEQFTTFIKKQ